MLTNGDLLLGICIGSLSQERYHFVLDCLKKEAPQHNIKLITFATFHELTNSSEYNEGQKSVYELVPFELIDGLVIMTESIKDRELCLSLAKKGNDTGIPVFSIDEDLPGCCNIHYDYHSAFRTLVKHVVVDHQCKRINLMAGVKDSVFEQVRTNIYREVLEENGIAVEEERIYYGNFWDVPTQQAIDCMMHSTLPFPEAIVCENDSMAIAVCDRLSQYGYSVPEDLIVTGLDGIEAAALHSPSITTATQNHKAVAKSIIKHLKAFRKSGAFPEKIMIPFHTKIQQSCGCVPKTMNETNILMQRLQQQITERVSYDAQQDIMVRQLIRLSFRELIPRLKENIFYDSSICLRSDFNLPEEDYYTPAGETKDKTSFTPMMNAIVTRSGQDFFYNQRFPLSDIIPDFEEQIDFFTGYLFMPLHFQDVVFGYFATTMATFHLTYENLEKFCINLSTILEVIQSREKISFLNQRLAASNSLLADLYNKDPLTGLLNRRGFSSRFTELQTATVAGSQLVLCSIDMDDLKYINDTFGHKEGDYALCMIADCLKHINRKYDNVICARFGGDEFLLAGFFEPFSDLHGELLETFHSQMKLMNEYSGKNYQVKISIGCINMTMQPGFDMEALIADADALMYEQKRQHKEQNASETASC